MSSHCNPNIVEDGLVFLYDVDDIQSYKGEPTTNVMADPLPTAGWGVSNYLSSTATRTYSSENGIPHMEITNVNVDGSYPRINMANLTSTITDGFSISFEAKSSVADAQLYFALYSSGSTKTSQLATLSTEWQRFKFENLTTGFTLDDGYLRFPSSADSGTVYYIRRMQVEQKSHATPFVNGTRSATQGLIDRTGNETITLSNLSYDSNAQMSFDGTDDNLRISDPNVGTSFSIEVVIKVDNYSNGPIFISPNSVGIDHFFRVNSNGTIRANFVEIADSSSDGYTSTTAINTGEYYHVVISKTPSNGTIYVNGVAEDSHTPTLSAAAWTGDWRIGARWNNTFNLNGEIPILKVYNQALTAAEVTQNYNATKSRFV